MLFQILPDFLPCLYYLIPQNHSVIREAKLKHLQSAALLMDGTDSICVKTEVKFDALVAKRTCQKSCP